MKTLHELRQEKAKLSDQMKTLNADIGENTATSEQRAQWDTMITELAGIEDQIQQEERSREADQKFAEGKSGGTGGDWVDTSTGEKIPVYRSTDRIGKESIEDTSELGGLNLGGFMKAAAIGAKTDAEKRALDSGVSAAGGVTVPAELLSRWIDRLRDKSQAISAGAQTVVLNAGETSIARLEADPVPGWRVENALVAESEPNFGAVKFSAKSLAVLTRVSEEILQDSVNIDEILMSSIASAMAGELDRASLWGNGGTDEKPEPTGVANTTGILTLSAARTNGYKPIMDGCGGKTQTRQQRPL